MKKRLYLMVLAIAVFLSACAKEALQETGVPQTTSEQLTETTMSQPTEATVPLHSPLYLPDYHVDHIWEYFEEVVLDMEYTHGAGDASLVQKWVEPIGYRIYGSPTQEDLAVLNNLFARLNQIPGFPGFYTAEAEGLEDLRIDFLEPAIFLDSYSSLLGGENANGATQFWYNTASNELYSARIGYRTDIDQSIRNSILIEEVVNSLGISDTLLREDSITYQFSDLNTDLSDVDWILLNLLYHPDIRCGMNAAQCAATVYKLYY